MNEVVQGFVLTGFIAFCRVGACFMIMPGLSSARVPLQVRLFAAIAATGGLAVHMWDQIFPFVRPDPATLAPMILSELMIGCLLGIMARIYVLAFQFIAASVTMVIGYGAPQGGAAVEDNEQQAPLAAIISFGALMLMFVFNFHHEIIRALVESYRIAPVNVFFNAQAALVDVTDTLSEAFMVVLRLGSPFIAYGLLVNLTIGFVNKLTPQIPIYFISLPFVIAGGLILVYFGVPSMLSLFADGFADISLSR